MRTLHQAIRNRPVTIVWPLLILALIGHGLTISPHPHVGYPAYWLQRQLDITVIWPTVNPISGLAVRVMDMVCATQINLAASAMNTAMALINLALFFTLVRKLPFRETNHVSGISMPSLAALAATAMLVVSPGFWWASSRPGPGMTGLFLLLTVIALLVRSWQTKSMRSFAAASLLLGLGSVESPAVLTAGALIALLVMAAYMSAQSHGKRILVFFFLVSAGTLPAFLILSLIWKAQFPDPSWLQTMAQIWKHEMRIQIFSTGWLALAIVIVATLALSLQEGLMPYKQFQHRHTRWVHIPLAAALVSLFFIDPIAADIWRPVGAPLLMPWVLISVAFGGLLTSIARPFIEQDPRRAVLIRHALISLAIIGGLFRYGAINPRHNRDFQFVWNTALDGMMDDDWIVTDGLLDTPLGLAAHQRGRHFVWINPALEHLPYYRRQIAGKLKEPRYQSMASVGSGALIAERFMQTSSSNNLPDIRAFGNYYPLVLARFQPVPSLTRYESHAANTSSNLLEHIPGYLDFWTSRHLFNLRRLAEKQTGEGRFARMLLRYLSRVANDTGVSLDLHGHPREAALCYQRAHALNRNNISAQLNLMEAENQAPTAPGLISAIQAECRSGSMASLALRDGIVFKRTTVRWMNELCRWNEGSRPLDPALRGAIQLFLSGQMQEAYAAAQKLTASPQAPREAWMLLAVLADELKDEAGVTAAMERMKRSNERWAPLLVILGDRAMERGAYDEAARLLEEAHRLWPLHHQTLESLIKLYLHLGQEADLDRHVRWLLSIDPWNPWANFVIGLKHARAQQNESAESALLIAISRQPLPIAYNNLAWLLLEQDKKQEALFYVRQAINLEPYGPAQWDTLASVLIAFEEWDAAGTALKTALQLHPDSPSAAVHYMYWKKKTGRTIDDGETAVATLDDTDVPASGRIRALWEQSQP